MPPWLVLFVRSAPKSVLRKVRLTTVPSRREDDMPQVHVMYTRLATELGGFNILNPGGRAGTTTGYVKLGLKPQNIPPMGHPGFVANRVNVIRSGTKAPR